MKNYRIIDLAEEKQLMICKFSGMLDAANMEPLLADLKACESRRPSGFNRFTDLSEVEGIALSIREIHNFAERRSRDYQGPAVRSVIYASNPLYFGMMRVYAAVMDPSPISVDVVYTIAESAAFLGLRPDELRTFASK